MSPSILSTVSLLILLLSPSISAGSSSAATGSAASGTPPSSAPHSSAPASSAPASGTPSSGTPASSASASRVTLDSGATPSSAPSKTALDIAVKNMLKNCSVSAMDLSQTSLSWGDPSQVLGDCESLRRASGIDILTYETQACTGEPNTTSNPFYSIGAEGMFMSFKVGRRGLYAQEQLNFAVAADFHDAQGHVYNWECTNVTSVLAGISVPEGQCMQPPSINKNGWIYCWSLTSWADACQFERIQLFDAGFGPAPEMAVGYSSHPNLQWRGLAEPTGMPEDAVGGREVGNYTVGGPEVGYSISSGKRWLWELGE